MAFMKATNLHHLAMHAIVLLHAMAIEKVSKEGTFCIIVLFIVSMSAAGAIRSE